MTAPSSNRPSAGTERLHGSAVAIDGMGVLLLGQSGSGKSDLALRLIDRGAQLVADDIIEAEQEQGALWVSPPPRLAGLIELRGLGIHQISHCPRARAILAFDLDRPPLRLPEVQPRIIAGVTLPALPLAGLEPSAPNRVEWALRILRLDGINGFDVDRHFRLSSRDA